MRHSTQKYSDLHSTMIQVNQHETVCSTLGMMATDNGALSRSMGIRLVDGQRVSGVIRVSDAELRTGSGVSYQKFR
jgi:hypothetical protein